MSEMGVNQSGKHGGDATGVSMAGSGAMGGAGVGGGVGTDSGGGWGGGGSGTGVGLGGGGGAGAGSIAGQDGGDVSDNTSIGDINISS